jgi:ribose 1,5-bisphosphokinase
MAGRLFFIVGASGVGKDTLIRHARDALPAAHAIVFAHRYITRPAEAGGENHVALSDAEFTLRERNGLFAMSWESNGCRYGIGVELDAWLAKALTVVVNGSRGYVAEARRRYPDCVLVWISAAADTLAARLAARGRESGAQIDARLQRNAHLGVQPPPDAFHIRNDGPPQDAGERLVEVLTGQRPSAQRP